MILLLLRMEFLRFNFFLRRAVKMFYFTPKIQSIISLKAKFLLNRLMAEPLSKNFRNPEDISLLPNVLATVVFLEGLDFVNL